jgi:nucleoside-diphosphate-sugar epimerase
MKILVTGANGFLGRRVVAAFCESGHAVRALVRPSARVDALLEGENVELVRSDLRNDPNLVDALRGVDAVVHLAASMSGSDFSRFQETVTTSERLFDAMHEAGVTRLVLCSSFSVYDWYRAHGRADEDLALLEGADVYRRGGYATAKLWQERLAQRMAERHDWQLTIVRPGFIWGPGNECPDGSIGPSIGPFHLVFAAGRQLPFTHVVNAADCLRAAVEDENAAGHTFNLVDGYDLTAWRFKGEHLRRTQGSGYRVWLPYWLVWPVILGIHRVARWILGPRLKLPFLFMPTGFAQGYRPLTFGTEKIRRELGWHPPQRLDEALDATFPYEVPR